MAKIIWEGNQDWDERFALFEDEPLPPNAVKINKPENMFTASVVYMILPFLLCMVSVILKAWSGRLFPFDFRFALPSFIIGFIVAMPLHEILHAICYPSGVKVYVGIDMKKQRAYAMAFSPISKRRYIIMSLIPALTGIASLLVFVLSPVENKILNTLAIIPAFMGLISPAPDYLDVVKILRQVPKGAKIQTANQGLFWFK